MNGERRILKNCPISCFADEIGPAMDAQIALLKELGISWIEFRSGDGIGVADYETDRARRLKEKLDRNGIRVSAIGSPIGKIGIGDDFDSHMKKLDHVIDLAEIFGTSCIRMFSFYLPKGADPADFRDAVLLRTERMVNLAQSRHAVLLHENEKEIYGDTAERCLDLMQRFYGENFRCTFDFANFVQCGQDTLEAYEMLRPYIAYVHIKDAVLGTGEVKPAGEGDGHVAKILEKLDQSGYTGFLSLEPHLTDFAGFQSLERTAAGRGRTDGEAAFCEAYAALGRLLG